MSFFVFMFSTDSNQTETMKYGLDKGNVDTLIIIF